ncbi:endopeptidase La [bacterium]|nr:endopeptidase La [bacterium]
MAGPEGIENVAATGKVELPETLPLFTPSDLVFFPGIILPVAVTDEDNVKMIDDVANSGGSKIFGAFLGKPDVDNVQKTSDLRKVGTAVMILRMMRSPDGTLRMIVQGLERIAVTDVVQSEPYPIGKVQSVAKKPRKTVQLEALVRALREDFMNMAALNENIPDEFKMAVHNVDDPSNLADLIAANINIDSSARQQLLEETKVPDRIRTLRKFIERELQILQIGSSIQSKTREEIEKTQREYYLRQQLKQIKKELGEDEEGASEVEEWREKIEAADLPEHVLEVANKELKRLERINPASAEYTVVTTYLDNLLELPWTEMSDDKLDLKEARDVLDEDHYGLDDVKDRILEYLAVRKLKPDGAGAILCFSGPPGVGKTSLGQSIARSMGRKFQRMSLGGVRDEAEIRGHRRTYVGAMPGRILQALRSAGTRNPVLMLDEIDKLVSDFRGDPASALLEVLDPAQNHTFRDHYIEIEFDLSQVLFITTANYLENVPPPLLDRMEVIRLPGYITEEKVEIAKNYLVPRQLEMNGLMKKHLRITDKALEDIATLHTREAGVRNLERTIGKVCRKVAHRVAVHGENGQVVVKHANLHEYLGPPKVTPPWTRRKPEVGITHGLAYTPVGGSVLEIETTLMNGKGQVKVTGQLGDVMKESATIAHSWIRAHARRYHIGPELFTKRDVHLHVPAGATKKDGPSAGITMATSLTSLFTGRKVRSDLAMTGEITLSGHVLPIGGLREKVTAANRAKIEHVIIPWDNQKDLEEIPEEVRERIEFHPVKTIDDVLKIALEEKKQRRSNKSSSSNDAEKQKDTGRNDGSRAGEDESPNRKSEQRKEKNKEPEPAEAKE